MRRTLAVSGVTVGEDEFRELNQVYRDERSDRAEAIQGWPEVLAAARTHGPIGLISELQRRPDAAREDSRRGAGGSVRRRLHLRRRSGSGNPNRASSSTRRRIWASIRANACTSANNIQSDVEGALGAGMRAVVGGGG